MMRPNTTHAIAVLALPDGMKSGFALSCDILDAANRAAESMALPQRFETLTLRAPHQIPDGLSAVVLPGMGCPTFEDVATILATRSGRWAARILRAASASDIYIATSCAGVFVAAEAGVLDGHAATTSWFLEAELAVRYPQIRVCAEHILVESGRCLTGGAALAHAEVMLAVVEKFAGAVVADVCARYLLLDRRRSQRPYIMLAAFIQDDPQLVHAEAWIREHIDEPFSVGDVAAAVGLGARTFSRRLKRACGLTPIHFIQRLRLDVARTLINQGASVDEAAPRVGYSDGTALRRVFRLHA